MTEFVPGQRWVSEREIEKGLGIIVKCEEGTVTVFYPVTDETRIYRANNSPLVRIIFDIGD